MPNHLESLDLVFHALSDPTRRGIVERLGRGPLTVSELARPLPMALPSVMQHLEILEASGLVRSHKVGRVRTCRVEPKGFTGLDRWVAARRESWERRFDRLGEYLKETEE